MSQNATCLNCEHPVALKFCPECGQKTDTHRITFKHFVFHDILHGVWHFEKGMLFTMKQALLRPGKAALEYISGKRIRYYNVFYLILLTIGLIVFVESLYQAALIKYISYNQQEVLERSDSALLDYYAKYAKFLMPLAIPAFALNSFILFNKRKFNYSEHLIIFGMIYLGIILLVAIEYVFYFFDFVKPLAFIGYFTYYAAAIATFIYLVNAFYGAFGKDYKLVSFILRFIIFALSIFVYIKLFGLFLKTFILK